MMLTKKGASGALATTRKEGVIRGWEGRRLVHAC